MKFLVTIPYELDDTELVEIINTTQFVFDLDPFESIEEIPEELIHLYLDANFWSHEFHEFMTPDGLDYTVVE